MKDFKITHQQALIAAILALGVCARVWEFGELPPGLNQDEASTGVDAFSLYRFGIDRNGVTFPVHFISWGSGQNALYAYVLIPFIALGGLTPFIVRLPMLLAGIATLPLVYCVAKRTWNEQFALISLLLLAISPWHIILSRWGLESNFLPFVFLLGYFCILKSATDNGWFIGGAALLGFCLYAYGTAYVAVPFFLACTIPILLWSKRVSIRTLVVALVVFAIVALPIGLFLFVNTFHLSDIHLGVITIPRLPSEPRYETLGATFSTNFVLTLARNARSTLYLLATQTDGLMWNTIEPYGYFYRLTLPLAIIGAVQLLRTRDTIQQPERWLLLSWLAASLIVGTLQPVNTNRLNIIFIPLLLCMAAPLTWLWQRSGRALAAAVAVLLVCFVLFTRDYHGSKYRKEADRYFFSGVLAAVDFARHAGNGRNPICISGSVDMPYVFALFVEQVSPSQYLSTVSYVDPHASFRQVRTLGRYSFGQYCIREPRTIYVLGDGQLTPPIVGGSTTTFGNYKVYVPAP
jgi:hypothetical protein